jgi:hypothetical protein
MPIPGTDMDLRAAPASRDLVESAWSSLSPPSYFLSWGWIENFLDSLPQYTLLTLVQARRGNDPVCTFLYGVSRFTKKFPFIRRRVFVNTTGKTTYDRSLYLVYNSIPSPAESPAGLFQILEFLPCKWDDIVLPGLSADSFPGNCFETTGMLRDGQNGGKRYKVTIEEDLPSFYVDLDEVRKAKGDVLSLLSSQHRKNLKRSYRLLQELGPVSLEQADSMESANTIFEELLSLHQSSFSKRGRKSAFLSPFSIRFHENLIGRRFSSGEIQLARITAGNRVLGCVYSFVHQGTVFGYQTGLNHLEDSRISSGLVCHCEAIRHNAELGHARYDFLAGKDNYKSFFSNHHNRVIWVKVSRVRF